MKFLGKYNFNIKDLILNKIQYNNALLFVSEFEEEFNSGKISNLGPAYGYKFDDFCDMFENNYNLESVFEEHYVELSQNKMTENNPLSFIKDDEFFYTIQKYAELNYVHLPLLDLNLFTKPETKKEAFEYYNSKHILVVDNIAHDSHIDCNIDGLTAFITIDKNTDVSNELLKQWVINYHLLKDEQFIGILQADLVTSEHAFDDSEYFMAMDEDSDFLSGEAHAIVSDYLQRPDSVHENINQLYTENFELSSNAGTLHIFNAEICSEFRHKKLLHVMIGSLIDSVSNNEVCNINLYLKAGFDQSSKMSELTNYSDIICNRIIKSDIDISFISLVTMNLTLGNFISIKECSNQQELITEKINLLSVENYLAEFEYDLSYLNVLDEPPVKIFVNQNKPPERNNDLSILHQYIS